MKFEEGGILLLDRPIFMIPADALIEFQKELEKVGRENAIYEITKKCGYRWTESVHEYYKFKSAEELAKTNADCVTMAGFGVCTVEDMDFEKGYVRKILKNSKFAKYYGNSEFPVDHFIRGLCAGAAQYYMKGEYEVVETKCAACGDSYCEFITRKREDFDFSDPLVKRQLGVKDV